MKKILHIGLIVLALTAHCEAVISVASPSSEWTPILNDGGSDPAGDNQTGNTGDESDIIGDSSNPALYKLYDGTNFGFRLRLGAQDKSQGYSSAALFGLDVNSDSNLDYYIAAKINVIGSGNEKLDIGIYAFTGPATSPSTTSSALDSASNYLYGYEQNASNFNWSSVASIDGAPTDLDGEGNPDYFLSILVPFADLQSAIATTVPDFDQSSPLAFVAMTSQNLQQVNNDFNGIDGSTTSNDTPYSGGSDGTPVGITDPYTPESTSPVPEPSTYALLFGLISLGVAVKRRRP